MINKKGEISEAYKRIIIILLSIILLGILGVIFYNMIKGAIG